ncbi:MULTISPECIES: FtsX-like permease family protein [unclassified Streptomyces]|uniref:FtsX-like permease family protein n=1 Tax=unclassified Streptomyces TaxID=2593676 RepID=UPI0006F6D782|nr:MULTISPECIES: FtsX-like permease family protein [unclassified Streptomyces]KQX49339.1 ABC transporter permease [Streptomyces sp. Root1304]KRA78957.1 ABC transporter permease [Streptomyces sp. Root66D1]
MNSFLLGLRLLWGGGRRGHVRFLLMTLGSALGVACLAAVLTIPTIIAAHDARTTGRAVNPGYNKNVIYQEFLDPYGSQPLRRVFFGHVSAGPAPVPPGIDRLPRTGEAIVSPKLAEILAAHPNAAGLVPGRVAGTIAPVGLGGPDELYAYIGTDPANLPEGRELGEFGATSVRDELIDPSTLNILRFTLGCIVLLPLVIFLSVCARLSGESRARRLAALRLVGLSVKDTLRVNAGEGVAAALAGSVIGIAGYLGVNEVMARIGLPGIHWYAADGIPSGSTLALCLLGCPALAWVVGQFSARRAALSPISARRTGERRPPRKFGTLLLIPGLGIIGGYCTLSVMGRDPSGGSASSLLVPGAVLLTGAGLVFGLAPITAWLARRVAGVAKSLPVSLAMRRTEVDPGSSLRVATGLVLLVFGAALTQGVLIELDQVSRRTAPLQEYNVPLDTLDSTQRKAMAKVPGVRTQVLSYRSWDPLDGSEVPHAYVVVATCAQLNASAERATDCADDKIMQLRDDRSNFVYDPQAGERYPFALKDGRKVAITVPRERIDVRPWDLSVFDSGAILIPPSLLPTNLADSAGTLTLVSDADPATIRSVLDGIGAIAPTASVEPVGIVIDALAQLAVIRSLLAVGMVLGLVIGVAAFVVSVADRAMERRGQVAALVLLGARAGTLRGVQVVQVLLPLVVGLGAAIVAGWLAESSYLITGGGAVHWDWDGLPLLFLCALGVLLAAGLASLPMVRRHVDPEQIRRD